MIPSSNLMWILLACTLAGAQSLVPDPSPRQQPSQREPTAVANFIGPGDRVLFVGDDLTQQMFYTRAAAAGVLATMPEAGLRFFNGGRDGATASSAVGWIDALLDRCSPTVVFICFGLNDSSAAGHPTTLPDTFADHLDALVAKIQQGPHDRRVAIIGPPPLNLASTQRAKKPDPNSKLKALSEAAQQVASQRGAVFIDLFGPLQELYHAAHGIDGEPLTYGSRLPTQEAHMVIASVVLRDIGIQAKDLDRVGWSPLRPLEMRRIRPMLAIGNQPAGLEQAELSHALYMAIQRFDELFFKFWRLLFRRPDSGSQDALLASMGQAWADVETLTSQYPPHPPDPSQQ